MNGSEMFIGQKVKVTFTGHWAIPHATYTYEGFDSDGHWVRTMSGTQRYLINEDVAHIEIVDGPAMHEGEF